jgi:hypothetical protein
MVETGRHCSKIGHKVENYYQNWSVGNGSKINENCLKMEKDVENDRLETGQRWLGIGQKRSNTLQSDRKLIKNG